MAHGAWDEPKCLKYLYEQPKRVEAFVNKLREDVKSDDFVQSYVGLGNIKAYVNDRCLWGWKEPRTTVLWPLWYKVFPKAKFIFIHRNGVDVAQSLSLREHKKGITKISNYYSSMRCIKLERAFKLWEEYNEMFYELREYNREIEVLEICYEKLLENPKEELMKIAKYLDISVDDEKITQISNSVNKTRSYSFLKDEELLKFYQKVKDTSIMKKFSYDNINI